MSNFPVRKAILKGNYKIVPGTDDFSEAAMFVARNHFLGQTAAVFDIQNVYDSLPHAEGMKLSAEDLSIDKVPSVPPFDTVWMEFRSQMVPGDFGVLVFRANESQFGSLVFELYDHGFLLPYPIEVVGGHDEDGFYQLDTVHSVAPQSFGQDSDYAQFSRQAAAIRTLSQLVFAFTHCKNVELVERLPKRHEQREAKRRGEPILKYHEIVIDPGKTKQVSVGAGSPSQDHPSRAMHIARGHFATYTEDKPLFGKYVGTFWRPAHVRGSAELGTVNSTYKVKAVQP